MARFNRKPLTDEERDARRKADRDRIEEAARALLAQHATLLKCEGLYCLYATRHAQPAASPNTTAAQLR